MSYVIVKLQNAGSWSGEKPTVCISINDPEWSDAHANWLKGAPPTDSKEWTKGVFAITALKSSLRRHSGSAKGNAEFWKDHFNVSISGPGDYKVENYQVSIVRAGKVTAHKDFDEKRSHPSAHKYGFGQMFLGQFTSLTTGSQPC